MKTLSLKVVLCVVVLLSISVGLPHTRLEAQIISQDGKYKAVLSGKHPDIHYEIKEVSSGKVLFTTHAEYRTPNDVKAGIFLFNSRLFAAAYHYGHKGSYTWIGIWDMTKKYRIQARKESGWIRDLSFLSKDGNLKTHFQHDNTNRGVFYFKVLCPSSIRPCYTTAVQANNSDSAKMIVQREASNCRVVSITAQEYYNGCQ